MGRKKELYDQLCALLTDWEHPEEATIRPTVYDLYAMLVRIQNNWETITGE